MIGWCCDRPVRVPTIIARAAQFLAIVGEADPQEAFVAALAKSNCRIETNLILNMAVQLADGETDCKFDFTKCKVIKQGRLSTARLSYLHKKQATKKGK